MSVDIIYTRCYFKSKTKHCVYQNIQQVSNWKTNYPTFLFEQKEFYPNHKNSKNNRESQLHYQTADDVYARNILNNFVFIPNCLIMILRCFYLVDRKILAFLPWNKMFPPIIDFSPFSLRDQQKKYNILCWPLRKEKRYVNRDPIIKKHFNCNRIFSFIMPFAMRRRIYHIKYYVITVLRAYVILML